MFKSDYTINYITDMENILKDIETRYPVDEILVNGEQIWPYLRWSYCSAYIMEKIGAYGEEDYSVQQTGSGRPVRHMKWFRTLLHDVFYGFRNWFRKYDYVVLTSRDRKLIAGQYINRFLDPIIDELGQDRVLCIENASPHYPVDSAYTKHIVSYRLIVVINRGILTVRKILRRRYIIVNKRILDMIEADYGLNVDAAARIEVYEATRKAFTCLFRLIRPNALLLTCYYGRQAEVKAAKSLGIKVIEVQHGVIGKEHPAYNVYCDIDRSCFPDYLLVFGKQELATFDNSRFIDPANVHPVGSFYIDYIKDSYRPDPHLSERLAIYKRVSGVTLQEGLERRLISFICEAAKLDGSIF